jgi:hypothetical protein
MAISLESEMFLLVLDVTGYRVPRTYIEILHLNLRKIEAGILDHFAVLADSRKHNERNSRKNRSNSDDAAQRLQRLVRTILSCQTVNFVALIKINRRAHA